MGTVSLEQISYVVSILLIVFFLFLNIRSSILLWRKVGAKKFLKTTIKRIVLFLLICCLISAVIGVCFLITKLAFKIDPQMNIVSTEKIPIVFIFWIIVLLDFLISIGANLLKIISFFKNKIGVDDNFLKIYKK